MYFVDAVFVIWLVLDEPEIGDMDKGVVEGCEDTGDAEDEFT